MRRAKFGGRGNPRGNDDFDEWRALISYGDWCRPIPKLPGNFLTTVLTPKADNPGQCELCEQLAVHSALNRPVHPVAIFRSDISGIIVIFVHLVASTHRVTFSPNPPRREKSEGGHTDPINTVASAR